MEAGIWSPGEAGWLHLSQTTVKNDFYFAAVSQELLVLSSDIHTSGQGKKKKITHRKLSIFTALRGVFINIQNLFEYKGSATFTVKHTTLPWFQKCSEEAPVHLSSFLCFTTTSAWDVFRPNLSNLLCFLHRTVTVRYMSVLNKHSCKHLGKWKFALGENITNLLVLLVLQKSYFREPLSWEMPISVTAGTTSHKQIQSYYKNKIPGPNRKKHGCR